MRRRLFEDGPGQPWTDEGLDIARRTEQFVVGLLEIHDNVDLTDLLAVLHSSVGNPILSAKLRERLS